MSAAQYARAQREGWAVFDHNGSPYVQRLDELDKLPNDAAAIRLARRMGLDVERSGLIVSQAGRPRNML